MRAQGRHRTVWNEVFLTVLLSRSEMPRTALTECLLSYGSMAPGAMGRRKAERWVREIEDLSRRLEGARAMLNPGHHVRAKIARGAEASSRSEGLAYARSERSVEP